MDYSVSFRFCNLNDTLWISPEIKYGKIFLLCLLISYKSYHLCNEYADADTAKNSITYIMPSVIYVQGKIIYRKSDDQHAYAYE